MIDIKNLWFDVLQETKSKTCKHKNGKTIKLNKQVHLQKKTTQNAISSF